MTAISRTATATPMSGAIRGIAVIAIKPVRQPLAYLPAVLNDEITEAFGERDV